jgi:mono/diheme cytochrome c family protein
MKKTIVIFLTAFALYSCAKKMTPAASASSSNTANATVAAVTTATNESKPTEVKTEPTIAPVTSEVAINNEAAATDPMPEKKETKQVVAGKETFKAKCGRCHELKPAETYTAAKWVKIIDWMAPKAKLDESEKENVLAYVSFYAKA